MLSPTTRLRLQEILERIATDQPVSLRERIYLQKFADRDATVAGWLRQARRRQRSGVGGDGGGDGIDRLLADLNLGSAEPDEQPSPRPEDLGDWFGGAPGWLRRS
ncbi:MAG: hypothetical protein ACKOBY_04680 [Cyanobium sp.]